MSCDVAAAGALLLAAFSPSVGHDPMARAPQPQLIFASAPAPASVAGEPLFADIVSRAGKLKKEVAGWRTPAMAASDKPLPLPKLAAIKGPLGELSTLDEKGRQSLIERGAVDDLKCILHGISVDLPLKLADIENAPTGKAQDRAIQVLEALLRDNVEVITAKPQPAA